MDRCAFVFAQERAFCEKKCSILFLQDTKSKCMFKAWLWKLSLQCPAESNHPHVHVIFIDTQKPADFLNDKYCYNIVEVA